MGQKEFMMYSWAKRLCIHFGGTDPNNDNIVPKSMTTCSFKSRCCGVLPQPFTTICICCCLIVIMTGRNFVHKRHFFLVPCPFNFFKLTLKAFRHEGYKQRILRWIQKENELEHFTNVVEEYTILYSKLIELIIRKLS